MNPSTKQLAQGTIIAGALLLAMTPTPATQPAAGASLTIQCVAIHGTEVALNVTNRTSTTLAGTLLVRVLVNGGEVLASARVTVGGTRTVAVTLDAGSPVLGAFPLGVVLDDGVPF
jgi:hypothetical protein